MGQADAARVARRRVEIEPESRARRDLLCTVGEGADAQLGALQVGEDRDRPADLGLDLADHGVAGGDVGVCRGSC